jgi:hypothetical protein
LFIARDAPRTGGEGCAGVAMYREMDMRFWLERAQAALGEVG